MTISDVMNGVEVIPGYECKVCPEYRDLIPKIADEELELLKSSLIREGCRDALIVGPSGYLLDGHNRLRICLEEHIEFPLDEVVGLETESDEKLWILRNQIGRRNLTKSQLGMLAGRANELIEVEKTAARERQKTSTGGASPQLCRPGGKAGIIRTEDNVGKQFGVSGDTVRRAQTVLESGDEELIKAVDTGKVTVKEAARTVKQKQQAKTKRKHASPRLDSKRGKQVQQAGRRKIWDGLSSLRGICRVLEKLDLEFVCQGWEPDEIRQWAKIAKDSAKTIGMLGSGLDEQYRRQK